MNLIHEADHSLVSGHAYKEIFILYLKFSITLARAKVHLSETKEEKVWYSEAGLVEALWLRKVDNSSYLKEMWGKVLMERSAPCHLLNLLLTVFCQVKPVLWKG